MKRPMLSRRTVLRGAGGIAIGLPLLEIMGCSGRSRSFGNTEEVSTRGLDGQPKRLVLFYTQNGTIPDLFWPTGSESSFQLSPILSPLASYRSKLLVLKGIDNAAAIATTALPGGFNHSDAVACAATGRISARPGSFEHGGGISIDQHVANTIGTTTRLKSLEFGVEIYPNVISYSGPAQPIPYEGEPANIYDRMFLDYQPPGGDPALTRLRADRRSIIDGVAENFTSLNRKLGRSDRQRLDMHLTMLRDVERRLGAPQPAGCSRPPRPGPYRDDPAPTGETHLDILALAFACDFTRVCSIGWGEGWYWRPPLSFPYTDYHANIVHYAEENQEARNAVARVKTEYARRLAYLLDRLASMPEGTGTVLDNTLLIWLDEFQVGARHAHECLPYVMIGSPGQYFRTGRFIEYTNRPANNRLWISVMNAMGLPGNNFGDPAFGNTPLPNLT